MMDEKAESDFIEALGLIMQSDGLPRIAGRLMGFFVLHPGPFSFHELSERLQISRASVSTNTRLLEDLGAIERISKPGKRQDYFRLAPNPYESLLERFILRARRSRRTVSEFGALAQSDAGQAERIAAHARFYSVIAEACEEALPKVAAEGEIPRIAGGVRRGG